MAASECNAMQCLLACNIVTQQQQQQASSSAYHRSHFALLAPLEEAQRSLAAYISTLCLAALKVRPIDSQCSIVRLLILTAEIRRAKAAM
jgi:hypothetical protein